MQEEKHVYINCPTCGAARELLGVKVWGYKGRYAEHIFLCAACQVKTTYTSELTFVGDWILSKKIENLGERK